MTDSVPAADAHERAGTRDVTEPASLERDLFEQYDPCPACGAETVTYSMGFEESDLTCYTCGHWLDVHEAMGHGGDGDRDGGQPTATGRLLRRLRSGF